MNEIKSDAKTLCNSFIEQYNHYNYIKLKIMLDNENYINKGQKFLAFKKKITSTQLDQLGNFQLFKL